MSHKDLDVVIVGAGVLGATTGYWLSALYDCSVGIIDREPVPAAHASGRNTGVVHRPYYLDPSKKKLFARSACASLPLWRLLAAKAGLPWSETGTLQVAAESDIRTIEKHYRWGLANGMAEEELALLSGADARALEPEVMCDAALHCRTDVSTDYAALTRSIVSISVAKGVRFYPGHRLESVREVADRVNLSIASATGTTTMTAKCLVNVAGGGALGIAHSLGLGTGYAVLNFRGEYWGVAEPFASRVTRNVYPVPRHPQFPFLDPHLIVGADGRRQVGPNAVPVAGAFTYSGFGLRSLSSAFQRPLGPKLILATNPTFLSLISTEWRSSLSRSASCDRVKRYIPRLQRSHLAWRGLSGVRSSVVDIDGFLPEAVTMYGKRSAHVVNYNSPGATGAPVFSAVLVSEIARKGLLDGIPKKPPHPSLWDFDQALSAAPSQGMNQR